MNDVSLCLCGDVMTGRGIDQILPYPGDADLHERYVGSSRHYVDLAQARNGAIPMPVDFTYVWGDALEHMRRSHVRIINLETSITTSAVAWPKGIHYRMNPANAGCVSRAQIDCCALANNHVMDYGLVGLHETLDTLRREGIACAGAGRDETLATSPVVCEIPGKGRVIVLSFGSPTSGIPAEWAAAADRAGVNWLAGLNPENARRIAERIHAVKRTGDIVVFSIHWDVNFGYDIPQDEVQFAHALIDLAGVDVVHGHSSHHVKAIEIYRRKLILYGCGDFLNDYEGIPGYEEFRDDLVLLYVPVVNASTGSLERFSMRPFQIKRFRLRNAQDEDARWLCDVLNRESAPFATSFTMKSSGTIEAVV